MLEALDASIKAPIARRELDIPVWMRYADLTFVDPIENFFLGEAVLLRILDSFLY